ncbi:conserved hypothetical protein [Hyphomicrobiales bacterium]|jgi:hypothetical protein|nr:conserved hypothetical protein [Hyphomicrobiales bacterium]CAH1702457.1 conserved hypothetical protein [Hyphomicrobiales bacterium]CAI0346657.1 conserved hypothetical protein [Hyphomicrobiales bacterium]
MRIFLSPATDTGLSVQSGAEVEDVSALPDCQVELHTFRSSDTAGAFVAGLELAGSRNTLAWTWQPGADQRSNRTVVVLRLDEPRPPALDVESAVRQIGHDQVHYESTAQAAAMDALQARRREADAEASRRTSSLRAAGKVAGFEIYGFASNWVRIGPGIVSYERDGMVVSVADGHEGNDPTVRDRYAELAPPDTRYDPQEHCFVSRPLNNDAEVIRTLRAFQEAVLACAILRKEAWHTTFVASMKMSAPRRRFVSAAAESGIRLAYHRNNLQASAGGIVIGATEFSMLERVGWVRRDGMTAAVTDEGLAAADLNPSMAPRL